MTERISRRSVEFRHPFTLGGVDGEQPAGSYDVETVDEQIDGLTFVAYRRLSTTIALVAGGPYRAARQLATIDPADLVIALKRDEGMSA